MTSTRTTVRKLHPARRLARGLLAAWPLLGAVVPVAAMADVSVYQAVVPLQDGNRAAAFGEALKMAAVRASGRTSAATAPRIVAAAADPTGYVQQYSTTPDRMLKVGFDARAMEQLLSQAGLPLWPDERPTVTVLLFTAAVAGGARAVTVADRPPERSVVEHAAQARGVPVAWPAESVDAAGARARLGQRGATLVGTASGRGFDWSFSHAGQSAQGQGDAAAGVALAADLLAERYAPASTRSMATVSLRIGGLRGIRDYAELSRYLEGLSLVRSVAVRELAGETVQFELTVRGDAELLARIFALDGRLVRGAAAGEDATAQAVDFVWRPT